MALPVVLETLSPVERAAFVLREVFGRPYGEVAAALGKQETATRQQVHRARAGAHVERSTDATRSPACSPASRSTCRPASPSPWSRSTAGSAWSPGSATSR
jgi:RNA polymerase sigma-70 factor (ECF subfamily)